MCCVSFMKLFKEDLGKVVIISFVVLRIALSTRFWFGIFPAVWHTVICI